MSPDAESSRKPGFRWGRFWFTIAALIATAWIATAWWQRPATTTFSASWSDEGFGGSELRRIASLQHPPPEGLAVSDFSMSVGSRNIHEVPLHAGHYLLSVGFDRPGTEGESFEMPLLVTGRRDLEPWRLVAPPAGFVPVPPGEFLLSRRGAVQVQTHTYYAARCEVTRAEYGAFLKALETAPRDEGGFSPWDGEAERIAFPDGSPGHGRLKGLELETHPERARWPVNFVSWYDAVAYCNWLTATQGEGKWTFRLPTSLEWQKMSRGTDGRVYPWGDVFERDPFREAQDLTLLPVDSLPERRSPYGLYLTEGNVAEWTADAADPAAVRRVVRGRSWSSSGDLVRFGAGLGDPATRRAPEIGFRVVADEVR